MKKSELRINVTTDVSVVGIKDYMGGYYMLQWNQWTGSMIRLNSNNEVILLKNMRFQLKTNQLLC